MHMSSHVMACTVAYSRESLHRTWTSQDFEKRGSVPTKTVLVVFGSISRVTACLPLLQNPHDILPQLRHCWFLPSSAGKSQWFCVSLLGIRSWLSTLPLWRTLCTVHCIVLKSVLILLLTWLLAGRLRVPTPTFVAWHLSYYCCVFHSCLVPILLTGSSLQLIYLLKIFL